MSWAEDWDIYFFDLADLEVYEYLGIRACVLSRFSYVCLCVVLWTVTRKLLCPWESPGKTTGVGCHVLLQGIFPTQGSNLCLLHYH